MTRRPYQSPAVDRLDQQRIQREERRAQLEIVTAGSHPEEEPLPPHSPRKRTPLVEGQAALPL